LDHSPNDVLERGREFEIEPVQVVQSPPGTPVSIMSLIESILMHITLDDTNTQ
jgi:hypothetical protein